MAQTESRIRVISDKYKNTGFQIKKITWLIQAFLVLFTFFNIGSTVWHFKAKYFSFDYWQHYSSLKDVYLSSQYVNKHPIGWIPDETLFSYAGGAYIKGINPILVNSEMPPLGKYIIGLSIIAFNNDSIDILISVILSLFLMYVVGKQIFLDSLVALIPPFLVSFEPFFKNQLVYAPLLDIFQLNFLLLCFYFFNKGLNSKKEWTYFILAGISLGLFISTKFFITGLTIVAAWFLVLLLRRKKGRFLKMVLSLPFSFLVLLLSYFRVFAFGYSLRQLLGIQKWVFLYHKSQLILPLSIWPLLLFNRWYVWFGPKPVISDPQWLITWPLVTIISITAIILYLFKKIERNINIEVLMAWFVFYVLFFSVGEISSRYFVIMLPVLYVISVYAIIAFYKAFTKDKKLLSPLLKIGHFVRIK